MLIAKDDAFPIEYSSLFILDESIKPPEPFQWTKDDLIRGCCYCDNYIHVQTMAPYAIAQLQVLLGEYVYKAEYQCVVQIPLVLSEGKLAVRAVNGFDLTAKLQPGNYKVVVAQSILYEDDETEGTCEVIDIFLSPTPTLLQQSEVLYVDPAYREEQSAW